MKDDGTIEITEYWIDDVMHTSKEREIWEQLKDIITPRSNGMANLIVMFPQKGIKHYNWYKNGKEHRDDQKPSYITYVDGEISQIEWRYYSMKHRDGCKPYDWDSDLGMYDTYYLYDMPYKENNKRYQKYIQFKFDSNTLLDNDERFNVFMLNINSKNNFISMYCKDMLGMIS